MQVLLEAIRTIHEHNGTPLCERVFRALDSLFPDSLYALEIFGRDGGYAIESNLPFSDCPQPDIHSRTAELVRTQSPMFQRLALGETSPMRLSDFISLRQLRRTDLYQEIFRQIHIKHQIGIPIQSDYALGGLTINRDHRDYGAEDLQIAAVLAKQIATAFEVDLVIRGLKPLIPHVQNKDHIRLRRMGLSRREAEVMNWIMEAKRDHEIAIILGLSLRTVHQHVRSILSKLGVENRTAAAALVLRNEALIIASTPQTDRV